MTRQHRGELVASFEWPSSSTASLLAYTERLQAEAVTASDRAVGFIHERVVAKARLDPDWEPLADHIEVWSQDGTLVVGVQDEAYISQAFALEYGDEVRPPSPLFRTFAEDIRAAGAVMDEHMESKFGYAGRFSAPDSA
jgi:hypothetical protein